jgi:hypothetical protein
MRDDILYDKKLDQVWFYDEDTALWSDQKPKK